MRWRGQRGSSDWPMCTVRSHGTSLVPGQVLKSTWLPSWQMSEGPMVKDNDTNAPTDNTNHIRLAGRCWD